jgi:hypothetical protein
VLHEVRSEYAQLLTVTFLLIVGAGPWSVDALLRRRIRRAQQGRLSGDETPPAGVADKELADIA